MRRRANAILICLATLLVASLSGCAGSSSRNSSAPLADTATVAATPSAQRTLRPAGASATPTTRPSPTPRPSPLTLRATVTAQAREQERAAALADGRALLQAQCAACHALASAGMSGDAAPPLDGIGAGRTKQWLEVQLVDPCAHPTAGGALYRCTTMPSYGGLTQQQRDQIVLYLLTQR